MNFRWENKNAIFSVEQLEVTDCSSPNSSKYNQLLFHVFIFFWLSLNYLCSFRTKAKIFLFIEPSGHQASLSISTIRVELIIYSPSSFIWFISNSYSMEIFKTQIFELSCDVILIFSLVMDKQVRQFESNSHVTAILREIIKGLHSNHYPSILIILLNLIHFMVSLPLIYFSVEKQTFQNRIYYFSFVRRTFRCRNRLSWWRECRSVELWSLG